MKTPKRIDRPVHRMHFVLWVGRIDVEDCDDLETARDRAVDICQTEGVTVEICNSFGDTIELIEPQDCYDEKAEWLADDNRARGSFTI